jgi:hypothetical protein
MGTNRFGRLAGATAAVGALIQIAMGIVEVVDRASPADPGFAFRTTLVAIAYVMLLVGVLGLARSRAAGAGWQARIGVCAACAGWLLSVVAQLTLQVDPALAERVLFPIGTVLIGLGMGLAGFAVLRTHRWQGWARFVPLLCGLYPFVVIFPVFTLSGGPNFLVLAAWGLCWLLLGVALRAETARRPQAVAAASSTHAAHRRPARR